ncbi:MAG: hypothetical protein PHR69_10090 [Sphaerochaeta sp.]|nr:hypothetical protein [Sphaerochaeta sp.]
MKNSAKINLVALGVVIIVNALANILPLGGMTTGEVSAVAVTIVFARRKAKPDEVFERVQKFHSA